METQNQAQLIQQLIQDNEITIYPIYGALHEVAYRFRFLYFMLTELDVIVSICCGMSVWYVVDRTGNGQRLILGICRFDPWGVIITIIAVASLISLFHWIRPEGNLELVLKNVFQKKLFAPFMSYVDRLWTPTVNH